MKTLYTFCVVHGGVSPPYGVFKDHLNMVAEITLGEAFEIKRLLYSQILEEAAGDHMRGVG